MSVIIDARDKLISDVYKLEPGSAELLRQVEAAETLNNMDLNNRKHEFEIEKEETRKFEKSNEYMAAQYDTELRKIELAIRAIDTILNPGSRIATTVMNNYVRMKRDRWGYEFETEGVIGSKTFSDAKRDKYD